MAPASVGPGPGFGLEEEGAEGDQVEWCKHCLQQGWRIALRHMQINDELAVFVCDREECTALPTLAPGSHLVVQRRAADIIHCRKRKRRATSLPSTANQLQKKPIVLPADLSKLTGQSQGVQQSCDPSVKLVSPLPATSIVQWPNEENMCWLDVSMLLLVQFSSLRRCLQALGATSPLQQLCHDFDAAQCMAGLTDQMSLPKKNSIGQIESAMSNNHDLDVPQDRVSDLELLSSCLRYELQLGKPKYDDSIDNGLLSDEFLSFFHGGSQSDTPHLTNSGVGCSAAAPSFFKSSNNFPVNQIPHQNPPCDSTSKIAAAVCALRKKRKELFKMIQPRLRCEEGKDDSPVAALQTLLRIDGSVEEHFAMRYRREFYCFSCGFSNVTVHKNAVMFLTATSNDFNMQHPMMHHPCPQCKAPGQTSRVIYHSMPACPLVHFATGLGSGEDSACLQQDFRHLGHQYQLTCVVQYKRDPDHFVTWIRDPTREKWLQCDGMSSPLCSWQSQEPSIPPSEVHILGWEKRNGDCTACMAFRQLVMEIEEAPLQREDATAARGAQNSLSSSSNCIAPLRKKSCPVLVGRSASPLTITSSVKLNSAFNRDEPVTASVRRHSLPPTDPANVLSIGTPPQSPEFQIPKRSPSLDSGMSVKYSSYAGGFDDELGQGSAEQKRNIKSTSPAQHSSKTATISHQPPLLKQSKQEPNNMSVGTYLETKKRKKQTVASVTSPAEHAGLLGTLLPLSKLKSSIGQEQALYRQAVKSRNRGSGSVLRTLRSLNANCTEKSADGEEGRSSPGSSQKKRRHSKPVRETPKSSEPPSTAKKITKVRLPRHKFDSFSAFKEKTSNTFSGYMKDKDPSPTDKAQSPKESHVKKENREDYQSSVLLTPSSSVSSPSACSEASLQNENSLGVQNNLATVGMNDTQTLTSTMDALCKALEVSSGTLQQETATQKFPYLDDDSFLEDLLK